MPRLPTEDPTEEAPERLRIGAVVYDGMDQIDFTGPYEVLAALPASTYTSYGLSSDPVRDYHGLRVTPDAVLEDAPPLDVLHVPGGPGQEALMDDRRLLDWLRSQCDGARCVLSVCTGALLLGAAGVLRGRRATTHWAAKEVLPYYGATVVDRRVVTDGAFVFASGVTAGLDAALTVAARVRGVAVAQAIQLSIEYAPDPPFDSGTPETAPPPVLRDVRERGRELLERRLATARRIAGPVRP